MTLIQIIQAIASFLIARLTALKTKIVAVETSLSTLYQTVGQLANTVATGLSERFTKTESDAQYLAIGGTAVNSTKVGGKTLATLESERDAADQLILNQSRAAARQNVRKAFRKGIVNGDTFLDFSDIVPGLVSLEDGCYQVFFDANPTASAEAYLTNASGATYTQQGISAGDVYIFNVTGGAVTDGVFVNNDNNVRFNAVQAQQDVQDGRLNSIEAKDTAQDSRLDSIETVIAGLDTSYVTEAEQTAAFQALYDALTGAGYTDPN